MEYSTQPKKVNLQILQSVLYSAEKDIPKLKISITFNDTEKYNKFINRFNPKADNENQIVSSEQEQIQIENTNGSYKQDKLSQPQEEEMVVDKLDNLQESIILKQFYIEEIDKITKQTNTRVLIVPSKVKYFGKNRQDIMDAQSQIYNIKNNININKINKWGNQIYQSEFYTAKLAQANIHHIKIAQKFVVWYDQTKVSQIQVQQVLDGTFKLKVHLFYPLFSGTSELYKKFNEKYPIALMKTKAYLFESFLKQSLNDGKQNSSIQLSKSKTDLIVHCDVKQQLDMKISQIKSLYENFLYFFISYDIEEQDDEDQVEIENISQIQKYLKSKQIFFYRYKNILVIVYQKQYMKKVNESIINQNSAPDKVKKQFLANLRQVFDLNLNCRIEILIDNQYGVSSPQEDIDDNTSISNKITIENRFIDRVKVITPKNKKTQLFMKIVDLYFLSPMLSKNKRKIIQNSQPNQTINISSINANSHIIDDTSNLQQSQVINNQSINIDLNLDDIVNDNMQKQQPQMKKNKSITENYKKYFIDTEKDKKYSQQAQQTLSIKRTGQSDFELSDKLSELIRIKYKVLKIKVPKKYKTYHQDIQKRQKQGEQIITMFIDQNGGEKFYERMQKKQDIQVYPLQKSKNTKQNGWLINVPKQSIEEIGYCLYLTSRNEGQQKLKYQEGKMYGQLIKYLKYIKSL